MGSGILRGRAPFRHRVSSIVLAGALLAGTSVGASLMVATETAAAATTNVDCSTTNLQTAIDNAAAGDTLVVTGVCKGSFLIDKSLTLLGSPAAVLDGQHNGGVLGVGSSVIAGFGANVTVANFWIVNGTQSGIFQNIFSGLTLTNDVVAGNSNPENLPFHIGNGGGIETEGTLTLNHTAVVDNTAGGRGGGIGTVETRLFFPIALNDSIISDNSAPIGGGIDDEQEGTVTAQDTTVSGNSGGGIDGSGTLDRSLVIGNTGGGLSGVFTLQDSWVIGNTTSGDGGGINGVATIDHSAVVGNTAGGNGGGIFVSPNDSGPTTLTNSVVVGNTASANGGGIFVAPGAGTPTLSNTTVNANRPNNCFPLGSVAGCTG